MGSLSSGYSLFKSRPFLQDALKVLRKHTPDLRSPLGMGVSVCHGNGAGLGAIRDAGGGVLLLGSQLGSPPPPHLILSPWPASWSNGYASAQGSTGSEGSTLPQSIYNSHENQREGVTHGGRRRGSPSKPLEAQLCSIFTSSTRNSSGTQKVPNLCYSDDHLT